MKTRFITSFTLLMVCFGLLGVMSIPHASKEEQTRELFEKYYKISVQYTGEELPIFQGSRCPGDHEDNSSERLARRSAKILYNTGEYQMAAAAMNEILMESPDDIMFPYYLGRTYLKLNQLDSAQIHFKNAENHPTSLHFEEAEWFYALTLLKKQDISGCKTLIAKICKNQNHYFFDSATLLKEELDNDFMDANLAPA